VAVTGRGVDPRVRLAWLGCPTTKAAAGATLHQLRHSALTHLAEDGASAPMLMTKSRHRSIVSLAHYARPGVEALQRWEAKHDLARRRR
jgi:integrase